MSEPHRISSTSSSINLQNNFDKEEEEEFDLDALLDKAINEIPKDDDPQVESFSQSSSSSPFLENFELSFKETKDSTHLSTNPASTLKEEDIAQLLQDFNQLGKSSESQISLDQLLAEFNSSSVDSASQNPMTSSFSQNLSNIDVKKQIREYLEKIGCDSEIYTTFINLYLQDVDLLRMIINHKDDSSFELVPVEAILNLVPPPLQSSLLSIVANRKWFYVPDSNRLSSYMQSKSVDFLKAYLEEKPIERIVEDLFKFSVEQGYIEIYSDEQAHDFAKRKTQLVLEEQPIDKNAQILNSLDIQHDLIEIMARDPNFPREIEIAEFGAMSENRDLLSFYVASCRQYDKEEEQRKDQESSLGSHQLRDFFLQINFGIHYEGFKNLRNKHLIENYQKREKEFIKKL